ncbi:hypothetical protein C8R44DRAFT_890455 [Mycena epipterygia]|nr:hypothetical protein C8R44DRAFT_890455 [Mycena epipterygia]
MKSPFNGPNAWNTQTGDLPDVVDEDVLSRIQYQMKDAQKLAANARRTILSQLGFLSWFQTIKPGWREDLEVEDLTFIKKLRLDERPKRGFLFDLSRDYHEINFRHLIAYDVPAHYAWTAKEEGNGRFVRYSPKFLEEYMELKAESDGGPIDLKLLPSFPEWEVDIGRYDVFFQDRQMGRVGERLTRFHPEDDYGIVDFAYYGFRPIENWYARRAYTERFKGMRRPGATHFVCTLFRQNPYASDEPVSMRRRETERPFPLTDFATAEIDTPLGRIVSSTLTTAVFKGRDRVLIALAVYQRALVEARATLVQRAISEAPTVTTFLRTRQVLDAPSVKEFLEQLLTERDPPCLLLADQQTRRIVDLPVDGHRTWLSRLDDDDPQDRSAPSDRSGSSSKTYESFHEEYQGLTAGVMDEGEGDNVDLRDDSPIPLALDAVNQYSPRIRMKNDAEDAITAWAPLLIQGEPPERE